MAEEPSSAAGMVKAIAKASDGTNILKETAKTFGTHSWRRGGDTALFRSGLSQQQRQLMGMWQTPTVELGYVGYTARQHMSWSRACAL